MDGFALLLGSPSYKVGNSVSQFNWGDGIPRGSKSYVTIDHYFKAGHLLQRLFGTGLVCWFVPKIAFVSKNYTFVIVFEDVRTSQMFSSNQAVLLL